MILFFFSIFVGTWNVAGRSPVGSLAVDLDEWLNLKSSADIYVLGYVYMHELDSSQSTL
jgi:phosphatidylinositol-bisphosphatase